MSQICNYLNIGKSWYYEKLSNLPKVLEYEKTMLDAIRQVRTEHPMYGIRKVWRQLLENGFDIGRDKVHKLMQKYGLTLPRRYKKVFTSVPGTLLDSVENKLKGLEVNHRNQVWTTDITYILTTEGILYLSVIMDLYSRKAIAYHIGNNLRTEGSLSCLEKAIRSVPDTSGIIHHSDHGCQYCSYRYLDRLISCGMDVSFTGKDHCYDNAKMERLFNTLKHEYGLEGVLRSKKVAINLIHNAIYDYNYNRMHAALDYKRPGEVYDTA